MRYLFVLALLVCGSTIHAEYFTIKDYHINVTLNAEGEALFEETITVEFSQPRHGIFRFIPYRSKVDGRTVDRFPRNIDVEGYKFSTSKENHNLVLKIGDADTYVDGIQTYRISYTIKNPLNVFDDHMEFYWDLLGVNWPVIVEQFSFRIHVPENVTLTREAVGASTGTAGQQERDVALEVSDHAFSGSITRPFRPNEGLTVAMNFHNDAFPRMAGWLYWLYRNGLFLAAAGFLSLGGLGLFMARNRSQSIMTEFFPPEGISPAVAGGFVDHSVDNHDVLSLIPHLGNKGYLRLEPIESGGLFKKFNASFHKEKEAGSDLKPFEAEFFHGLFATGDHVELQDLKNKFYTTLSSVRSSVKSWINDQGWYEADQKTMGCVTAFGGFAAIGWGAYSIFAKENLQGIALVAAGLILFFFASRFNKRSPKGNATYRKLEGFRRFVSKAERPVIERLMKDDPLYYDKTMPYALAFGYLKQWNKQFEGLLNQPPSWYGSPHMHGAYMMSSWDSFSTNFPSEVDQIGSVFSSAPSSSGSGGGFGGGGFSGGGSGGGGGGSW